MALRLVSQLLLGVVRIHSLKIDHLLGDCTQAVQRLDKAGHTLLLGVLAASAQIGLSAAAQLAHTVTSGHSSTACTLPCLLFCAAQAAHH